MLIYCGYRSTVAKSINRADTPTA